jgi:hypothetical protein
MSTESAVEGGLAMRINPFEERLAQLKESFDADGELYCRVASRGGRVAGGVFWATLALVPLALWPGIGMLLFWSFWMLVLAWQALYRPYEVRIAQSGLLRFVSVMRTSFISRPDILGIRRHELPSGGLHHLTVLHAQGSIQIDSGSKETFEKLLALSPKSPVTVEVYDPD